MVKIRILFEAFRLYHLPQYMPFYRLIANDPRFDIYFTISSANDSIEQPIALRIMEQEKLRVITADSDTERYRKLDAMDFDYVFVGWGRRGYFDYVGARAKPIFILIYHGIGVKAAYYRDNNPRINYRAVESPYRVAQLKRHKARASLLLTGFVKLDPLYESDSLGDSGVKRRLGLDLSRPTILYAPTFYPSSIGLVKQSIAAATRDYNLIIKLHNYTRFKREYAAERNLMMPLAEKFPHVILAPDEFNDILPLMRVSDLLITDASSVMFEYLPLDRPLIVFTKYDLIWRHRVFGHWFRTTRIDKETIAFRGFYDPITSADTLPQLVDSNLTNPARLSAQRKSTAEKLLYFSDGKSAQRLLRQFERIAGLA